MLQELCVVTAAGKAHEGIHKRRGVVASPGDPELIYRDCGMDEEAIAKRALSLLARK